MKEQWKKLDSDAKLLMDVEEGKQVPFKINIPLSSLTPPRDEFCCNRLLIVLRVCVLLALLTLLGWTATTLYSNYYEKTIPQDEQVLENKFAFQYPNTIENAIETNREFKKFDSEAEKSRDFTKEALDLLVAEMKGVNQRLNQIQLEKEQQQIGIKKESNDAKLVEDGIVTSERSDQTLDSMFNELAKEVGLAEYQGSDNVRVEYKPEIQGATFFSEPRDEVFADSLRQLEQDRIDLEKLIQSIEQSIEARVSAKTDEEFGYPTKVVNNLAYQPVELDNKFWNEKFDQITGNSDATENVENGNMNEETQKEFFGMWDGIAIKSAAVVNVDKSHEEDKKVDQVMQAVVNRMATSNLENDNDNEQQNEKERKVEDELVKEQDGDVEEIAINGFVNDLLETFFSDATDEATKEDDLSKRFDFENAEESHIEDKVEKEMIKQINQDFQDQILEQFVDKTLEDMVRPMMGDIEDGIKIENDPENTEDSFGKSLEDKFTEDGLSPSLYDELFKLVNDIGSKEDMPTLPTGPVAPFPEEKSTEYYYRLPSFIPSQMTAYPDSEFFDQEKYTFTREIKSDFEQPMLPVINPEEPKMLSENKEININEQVPIQEDLSTKESLIEMVPSVEYVKKIEENPFIPRVAKMLEPIVGQNHELLIWYYTHKDLPDFLRGADKWKVFGAKLLYDSNIKDYPADATIVSGLAFEKVYGGAEYPSSSEEIKSDLQQEIINRLILKSYLNKMLLEGNAEAETLSQVIEQHNQEKLKELGIDPQQLSYRGDFFEVDNKDDLIIPVVQFDPFVDESREANEQRARVIKAFGKTRNLDDEIIKPTYYSNYRDLLDSIASVKSEQVKQSESSVASTAEENQENSENSTSESESLTSEASPETSEVLLVGSNGFETSDNPSASDAFDWITEILTEQESSDSTSTELISEEVNIENTSPLIGSEYETEREEEVNMNDYFNY